MSTIGGTLPDHYGTLGVTRFATPADIKKAYHTLALRLHPDKNPDGTTQKKFQQITDAYSILNDSASKKTYDIQLFAAAPRSSSSSFGATQAPYRRPQTAGSRPTPTFQRTTSGSGSTGGFRPAAQRPPSAASQAAPSASAPSSPSAGGGGDSTEAINRDREAAQSNRPGSRSGGPRVSAYTLSDDEVSQLQRMRARDAAASQDGSTANYESFLRTGKASSTPKYSFTTPDSPSTPRNGNPTSPRPTPVPPTPPKRPQNNSSTTGNNNNGTGNASAENSGSFSFVSDDTVNSVLEAIRVQREELERADKDTKERLGVNEDPSDAPRPQSYRPQSATRRSQQPIPSMTGSASIPSTTTKPVGNRAPPTSDSEGSASGAGFYEGVDRPKSSFSSGVTSWRPQSAATSRPTSSYRTSSSRPSSAATSRVPQQKMQPPIAENDDFITNDDSSMGDEEDDTAVETNKKATVTPNEEGPSLKIDEFSPLGQVEKSILEAKKKPNKTAEVPKNKEEPSKPVKMDAPKTVNVNKEMNEASAASTASKSPPPEGSTSQRNTTYSVYHSTSSARGSASNAAAEARRQYAMAMEEERQQQQQQRSDPSAHTEEKSSSSATASERPSTTPYSVRPMGRYNGLFSERPETSRTTRPSTSARQTTSSTKSHMGSLEVPSDSMIGDMNADALKKLLDQLEQKTRLVRQELLLKNLS